MAAQQEYALARPRGGTFADAGGAAWLLDVQYQDSIRPTEQARREHAGTAAHGQMPSQSLPGPHWGGRIRALLVWPRSRNGAALPVHVSTMDGDATRDTSPGSPQGAHAYSLGAWSDQRRPDGGFVYGIGWGVGECIPTSSARLTAWGYCSRTWLRIF